jgi:hypothetical protein
MSEVTSGESTTSNEEVKLSKTMILLLNHAKNPSNPDFRDFDLVRNVLGQEYSFKMKNSDILRVTLRTFEDLTKEKRFEVSYHFVDTMMEILYWPFKSRLFMETMTNRVDVKDVNLEEFYKDVLSYLLTKFMLARVDWCRDQLGELDPISKVWKPSLLP